MPLLSLPDELLVLIGSHALTNELRSVLRLRETCASLRGRLAVSV